MPMLRSRYIPSNISLAGTQALGQPRAGSNATQSLAGTTKPTHSRSFPTEILAIIFVHVRDLCRKDLPVALTPLSLDMIRRSSSWLVITWVCAHWRRVAHELQPLWDCVLVPQRVNAEDQLALPGSRRPLSVTCFGAGRFNCQQTMQAVQEVMERVLPRLRQLAFEGPGSWISESVINNQRVIPVLESLTLSCAATEAGTALPDIFVHGTFPRLHLLSLLHYNITSSCGVLSANLRVLIVKGSASQPLNIASRHLLPAIKQMHSLEVLVLDQAYDAQERDVHQRRKCIVLPHLKALSIADYDQSCVDLLHMLSIPVGVKIRLRIQQMHLRPSGMSLALAGVGFADEPKGTLAPLEAMAMLHQTWSEEGVTEALCHIRVWRSASLPAHLPVSGPECMQVDLNECHTQPDYDVSYCSLLPFSVSELCGGMPFGTIRDLSLRFAHTLLEETLRLGTEIYLKLCPNITTLRISDTRLLEHTPRLLEETTHGQYVPIFHGMQKLYIPSLDTCPGRPSFNISAFAKAMASTLDKRKTSSYAGGPVVLNIRDCTQMTVVDRRVLRRAVGRFECATCGKCC